MLLQNIINYVDVVKIHYEHISGPGSSLSFLPASTRSVPPGLHFALLLLFLLLLFLLFLGSL
jgi:hypothetical protein